MKVITSHWFSGVWTLLVMLLSVLVSIATKDASHVARAGALVTLAGIFMTTRRLLVNSAEQAASLSDSGHTKPTEPTSHAELAQQEIEHLKAEKCGFWFLIVGTVIWAYGDLAISAVLGW